MVNQPTPRVRPHDPYGEMSSYLRARGMTTPMRFRICAIASTLSLTVALSTLSPFGPRGALGIGLAAAASGVALVGALMWAIRWPTPRQATAFAIASSTSITVACLAQSSAVAGLVGCMAFSVLATHLAFYYPAPIVAYNLAGATIVGSVESYRMIALFGAATAAAAFLVTALATMVAPAGLYLVVRDVGHDAFLADRDPLTGLLNRRAFEIRAAHLLSEYSHRHGSFVLVVVDLDRFKQLNDRHGHAVGDQALVRAADEFAVTLGQATIVGRIGGEEFAAAGVWTSEETTRRADALCAAVAGLPYGITASVGTASLHNRAATVGNHAAAMPLLHHLLRGADAAMYAAKAAGGNHARHHDAG